MMTETTLSFTRTLKARPASIWRCWTEPALLCQWFTPKPVETVHAEIDATPGGTFRTVMRIPDHGEVDSTGCILLAEPCRRLVFTNCLKTDFQPVILGTGPNDFGFTADLRIAPDPAGATYTVFARHADLDGAAKHEAMGFYDGWGTATTQLEALAATL